MNAKHSPGRWIAGNRPSSIVGLPVVSSEGRSICNVRATHPIAAAPDLLALAHKYADECSECGGSTVVSTQPRDPQDAKEVPCPAYADIWAVIDRAEGA